jgi:protein ImuB
MVACLLIPRFSLLVALGDRRGLIGRPVALAPEPGAEQHVGEVSGAAEAFGVHAGMRLGEALSRCPGLVLVPPDPHRAGIAWEGVIGRLEGIGAAVEPGRTGEAFFAVDPLRGLYGRPEEVLARARRSARGPARIAAAPTRFCAHAAAIRTRPGRAGRRRGPTVVPAGRARAFLAPLPVALLRTATANLSGAERLVESLRRLGIGTLGELAAISAAKVADRFGREGLRALDLARGGDRPLRPRREAAALGEAIDLPEAVSGGQLAQALELLVDRMLAAPERRGRTLRSLRLTARLAAGGSWSREVTLRAASASAERLRLALAPGLEDLPGPAGRLGLEAVEMGPPAAEQLSLARSEGRRRRRRLAEAIRQARAAAGRDAVLRILEVDPGSRIPERRVVLAPFPEPDGGDL